MSRRTLLLVAVLCVATAAIGGSVTARWRNTRPTTTKKPDQQSVLSINPRDLNLGEVWETDQFELVLPIRNTAATPVRIAEWRNSCSCLGVDPPSLEFGQSETKTVRVSLDLGSKVRLNPKDARLTGVNLGAMLGDGNVVAWPILATVKPLVKTYPDLVFPPVSELGQSSGPKPADLEFTAPVSIGTVESDSPFVFATLREPASSPQVRCPIELRFATTIPVGDHRFTVSVNGVTQSPRQPVVKRLGGILRIVPDIQGDPGQVIFPAKAIGCEGEETVVLKSLTGRGVQIESVATDGEGLTADWIKGELKLVVRQRSTQTGQLTTYVRVGVRSGERVYEVVIPVTSLWVNPS